MTESKMGLGKSWVRKSAPYPPPYLPKENAPAGSSAVRGVLEDVGNVDRHVDQPPKPPRPCESRVEVYVYAMSKKAIVLAMGLAIVLLFVLAGFVTPSLGR
jgi:hypothetical protein